MLGQIHGLLRNSLVADNLSLCSISTALLDVHVLLILQLRRHTQHVCSQQSAPFCLHVLLRSMQYMADLVFV